jgi:hypothetical protein
MPAITASIPQALKNAASWLVNAGADDMKRSLDTMTGTEKDITILLAAIEAEKSQPKLSQRVSRLKPMEAKLAKFQREASSLSTLNPQQATSSEVEIVTASQVDAAELTGLAEAISRSREIIQKHEQACHETTLEHYLDAGQQLARAQEIFTLSHSAAGALKGKGKESLSTVDKLPETSPEILAIRGFSAWLADALPDLKRPTAIRYATAYRSLGLPLTAKPAEIRAKLKTLRHQAGKDNLPMPTLAALVKAAPKPPKPEALTVLVPKSSKQLKLEDARETFGLWMQAFDKALKQGHLDNLDRKGLEQLKDFTATVRDRINARLK